MTPVALLLPVTLYRIWMYGCPVGDSKACARSPDLYNMARSMPKLMEKFRKAEKIMQRGIHLAALGNSSERWQDESALVRDVTGPMIPVDSSER